MSAKEPFHRVQACVRSGGSVCRDRLADTRKRKDEKRPECEPRDQSQEQPRVGGHAGFAQERKPEQASEEDAECAFKPMNTGAPPSRSHHPIDAVPAGRQQSRVIRSMRRRRSR